MSELMMFVVFVAGMAVGQHITIRNLERVEEE